MRAKKPNPPQKLEPPLYINMPFDEALQRFAQTDRAEVEELQQRAKQAKVTEDGAPARKSKRKSKGA